MAEYTKQDNAFLAYERAPSGTEPFKTDGEFSHLGKDWTGRKTRYHLNRRRWYDMTTNNRTNRAVRETRAGPALSLLDLQSDIPLGCT
jgi:hypothetical protein